MRAGRVLQRVKAGLAATSTRAGSALRRLAAPLTRPVFVRLYARVDARTALAVRSAQRAHVGGLDEVAEQLELARTAAVASATSARELRREHEALKARLKEVEDRLAELTARGDGPDPGAAAEAQPAAG